MEQTMRTVLLIIMLALILACGRQAQDNYGGTVTIAPPSTSAIKASKAEESIVESTPKIENEGLPPPTSGAVQEFGVAPIDYDGATSLEERIINYPTIVRATLDRVTTETIEAGGYWEGQYVNIAKFHLTVLEYLNGSGGTDIIAVWGSADTYGSRSEAEAVRSSITEGRDTKWDDVEAVFFLTSDPWEMFSPIDATDTYYTSSGDFAVDDFISVNSRYNKLWLPIAPSSTGMGDDKRFLLDAPENASSQQAGGGQARGAVKTNATSTPPFAHATADTGPPTITLRDLKARIAAINAEIDAGDGSEAYRKCVAVKYLRERLDVHAESEGRKNTSRAKDVAHTMEAGDPAGTVIYENEAIGDYPDRKTGTTWLEGGDAALFEVIDGTDFEPWDSNYDGKLEDGVDWVRYQQTLRNARPLPGGTYAFNIKDLGEIGAPCNDVLTHEWTVTVTTLNDTLHELLFDPVTDGTVVAADSSIGQLEPAAFTGANDASATIQRIEWAPPTTGSEPDEGMVKISVTPDNALVDHIVEFIELDGTVSLTLDVFDATVDSANDTLTWSVSSQPWHDGDLLMLRIREARRRGGAAP